MDAPNENESSESSNPFIGPRAYTEMEKGLFHGRDTEIEHIGTQIFASNSLLFFIYGDSGVGKTSLVQAGLSVWFDEHNISLEYENITNDSTLFNEISTLLNIRDHDNQRRVLCFDGFERVLNKLKHDPDAANFLPEIVKLIKEHLSNKEGIAYDARVLFILRSEWLAQLERCARLLANNLRTRYRIDPLPERIAVKVIVELSRNTAHSFTNEASEWVVNQMKSSDQVADVNLTILQVVCRKIWDKSQCKEIDKEWLETKSKEEPLIEGCLAEFFENALKESVLKAEKVGKCKDEIEERLRRWLSDCMLWNSTRKTVQMDEFLREAIKELNRQHVISEVEVKAKSNAPKLYELAHDRWVNVVRDSNLRWEAQGRVYLFGAKSFQDPVIFYEVQKHVSNIALRIREKEEREKYIFDPKSVQEDPIGDIHRHKQAQGHIGLMVLEGTVPFSRFNKETYKSLEWVRVRDAKEVRAYLLWLRDNNASPVNNDESNNYFLHATTLLKKWMNSQSLRVPRSDESFKNIKAYIGGIVCSGKDSGEWANDNIERLRIVKMKAGQLGDFRLNATDTENWLDSENYTKLFYESVLPSIEEGKKLEDLDKAIDLGRKNGLISCFEAAILMYYADVELVRERNLDRILD